MKPRWAATQGKLIFVSHLFDCETTSGAKDSR
jgi:hypothetical protein